MPVYKDLDRGTWMYRGAYYDIFGNRKYYTKRGFKTKDVAKKEERLFLLKVNDVRKEKINFDDLFQLYILYKKDRVKPRTVSTYQHVFTKHLKPTFGNMYIDKISIPQIENWQSELLKLNFGNEYLEKIQTVLKAVLRYGVRKLYIEQNPFDYIDYIKNYNEVKRKINFYTDDDYYKFRSVITKELHGLIFDALYWTGMRISELQARTWKDIDFKNGDLNIWSNFDNKNKVITNSVKVGEARIIYIPKNLLRDLEKYYRFCKQIDGFKDEFYIFGTNRPIAHKTVENAKNRYIALYNETHEDKLSHIRLHDFRHSHVSYLANNGADVWDIAERLGHSRDMVEKRYSHMFPEKRNKMKGLLD